MRRLLHLGLLLGMFGSLLVGCGNEPGTTVASGATPTTNATASPATTGTPPATTAPVGTATAATAAQCGTVTQNPDGSVAPPAPGYGVITSCLTGTYSTCQPAFMEFIARGTDAQRDYTFTVLRKDGVCQVYVNDHVQFIKGNETRNFYYCAKATQSGSQAILTGCDAHFTNGTIKIPA